MPVLSTRDRADEFYAKHGEQRAPIRLRRAASTKLDRHRLRINGLVIVCRELLFELPNTLLKLLHLFFEKS